MRFDFAFSMNILMTLDNPFITDARVYNEARSLVKNGHKVTILAWDKKRKHKNREIKDKIRIVRSYNTKFMNLLPFDILRLHWWWRKGYKDAVKLFGKESFDVVHSHDLASLPIGVKLKKKFNIPLIYDSHEIWGYMVSKDLPDWWASYYLRLDRKLIKDVNQIITVNEPIKKYFSKFTNKNITLVMNCKNLIQENYESTNNKKMEIIYIGGLKKPRFILEIADVISQISNVKFTIIGYKGRKEYIEKIRKKAEISENIEFQGKIPIEQVVPLTKKADIVILMTDPEDLNASIVTANKQFEAMVAGRPIICTKNTYPGDFTTKENVGIITEYDKTSLKKTILKLRDNPKLRETLGKNALKKAIEKYNWKKQEMQLLSVYEKIKNEEMNAL
jgi:glycosyltransferase involved in cell wall biosynthesis